MKKMKDSVLINILSAIGIPFVMIGGSFFIFFVYLFKVIKLFWNYILVMSVFILLIIFIFRLINLI